MKYALSATPTQLPAPAQTGPALYSVPRPDGGYDYWEGPPGSRTPQNDDLPLPNLPHPNDVGVSSLTLGRPLPPGARPTGKKGAEARGSVTPMPGVVPDGPLATGLGAYGAGDGLGFADTTDAEIATASRASVFALLVASGIACAVAFKSVRASGSGKGARRQKARR